MWLHSRARACVCVCVCVCVCAGVYAGGACHVSCAIDLDVDGAELCSTPEFQLINDAAKKKSYRQICITDNSGLDDREIHSASGVTNDGLYVGRNFLV